MEVCALSFGCRHRWHNGAREERDGDVKSPLPKKNSAEQFYWMMRLVLVQLEPEES